MKALYRERLGGSIFVCSAKPLFRLERLCKGV